MRLFPINSSRELRDGESGEALLYLNVYDLTPVNDYLYWLGFGIFHSGIEVESSSEKLVQFIPVSFAIDGIIPTNWGKRKLAVAAVGVEEVAGESGDVVDSGENEYRRRWGKMG
ncbi:hypothetical protein L1987_58765 [Smallanthus sonchifolius]|uniref:Uncharacterized protein n=1 Tax=Smallanthus sonchifolius TaxID=185202 RepID=A0ACB9D3A4_9ASTR|nr:hypothetical protein L1987_58765 [Smallanthus sonchifolius]